MVAQRIAEAQPAGVDVGHDDRRRDLFRGGEDLEQPFGSYPLAACGLEDAPFAVTYPNDAGETPFLTRTLDKRLRRFEDERFRGRRRCAGAESDREGRQGDFLTDSETGHPSTSSSIAPTRPRLREPGLPGRGEIESLYPRSRR